MVRRSRYLQILQPPLCAHSLSLACQGDLTPEDTYTCSSYQSPCNTDLKKSSSIQDPNVFLIQERFLQDNPYQDSSHTKTEGKQEKRKGERKTRRNNIDRSREQQTKTRQSSPTISINYKCIINKKSQFCTQKWHPTHKRHL